MTSVTSQASAGAHWARTVVDAGGAEAPAAAAGADLDARYAEPHRRYHDGGHVLAVLRDSAELAAALWLAPAERAAVALAACAHDVVYHAEPGADERASAAWAVEALSAAGVRRPLVHRVEQLVLATLTHEAPAHDLAAAVLLDADLAILAEEPPRYDAYVASVRSEYVHVDDEAWRAGRSAVLQSLSQRPRLYVTDVATQRWESRARRNMGRELAFLTFLGGRSEQPEGVL